jgi:cholesterol transport system auxiliary component
VSRYCRPRHYSRRQYSCRLIPLACLMLASLTLAACGGLFQTKAKPPTMYLLSAMPQPSARAAATPIPADLAVLRPRARAGLDTDRIAAVYPDRHLDYYADVRWSGPLDQVVQDMAVQEFHAIGGLRNVTSDVSAFSSAYWLELQVTDFQAEYSAADGAPVIHVRLTARLGKSADRRMLGRFESDIRQPASDNRMSAIVDAFNRAADQALAEIVAGATQAMRANN